MTNLLLRARDGTLRTFEVSLRPIVLGRADNCDVVLPHDGEVSREHARVWLDENGRVLVQDYKSKNGTRVDAGEPFHNSIRPATRSIRIGEYELEIVGARPYVLHESQVRFQADEPDDIDSTRFFPSTHHLKLDLNQQRLGLLMNLTERIGGAFEPKQLLEQALDACCEALHFERALIALKTPRGEPELPVTRNVPRDETGTYKISRSLINRALLHGERAVVNNPAVDLVNNLTDSLVRYPICSALCVPILHRDRILGVLYGDRVTRDPRSGAYTPADVDFLAAIARHVGVGLENLRLFQSHLESEKLKLELNKARDIQRRLLPDGALEVGRLVFSGHNEPSEEVGGDYFDYFDLGSGQVGFVIADVTGHGLAAAMMMANFQAAVRVALTADVPLTEAAVRLNRLVCLNTGPNVFITTIMARVDTATGAVEYVNAGHPAPLLLRRRGVACAIDGMALPLGIEPNENYVVQRIDPQDELEIVLFYTDGLIEAADPAGQLLNLAPVTEALSTLSDRTAEGALHQLLDLVRRHLGAGTNADDLTLTAIEYRR
jgi:serine phosphatase RsbU (regulator of sigma subunit)